MLEDFGKRLRELRQDAGLTQEQLAERIWISKAAVSNYELNERSPSPEILVKLANVFHVSVDYLLGIEVRRQLLDVSGLTDEDICFLENAASLLRRKNAQINTNKEKNRNKNVPLQ